MSMLHRIKRFTRLIAAAVVALLICCGAAFAEYDYDTEDVAALLKVLNSTDNNVLEFLLDQTGIIVPNQKPDLTYDDAASILDVIDRSSGLIRLLENEESKLFQITSLHFNSSQLTGNIVFNGFRNVETIEIQNNNLASLTVENCRTLQGLYAGNSLNENNSGLTLTALPRLVILQCSGNYLSELDVSVLNELQQLDCYNNRLVSLNLDSNTQLYRLNCANNNLTELNLSANLNLENLSVYGNLLTELDLSGLPYLWYIFAPDNPLKTLDLTGSFGLVESSVSFTLPLPVGGTLRVATDSTIFVPGQYDQFVEVSGSGDTLTFTGLAFNEEDEEVGYGICSIPLAGNGIDEGSSLYLYRPAETVAFQVDSSPLIVTPGENFTLEYAFLPANAAYASPRYADIKLSNPAFCDRFEFATARPIDVDWEGDYTGEDGEIVPGETQWQLLPFTVEFSGVTSEPAKTDITIENIMGGASGTISVYATKPVTALTAGNYNQVMAINGTQLLTANVVPSDAWDEITWISSDNSVATVGKNGTVTAKGAGEVTITAASALFPDKTTVFKVMVTDETTPMNRVTAVTLSPLEKTVMVGESFTFTAVFEVTGNPDKTLVWAVSDDAVASVDSDGKVTALAVGETRVAAIAANGVSGTAKLVVESAASYQPLDDTLNSLNSALDGASYSSAEIDDDTLDAIAEALGLTEPKVVTETLPSGIVANDNPPPAAIGDNVTLLAPSALIKIPTSQGNVLPLTYTIPAEAVAETLPDWADLTDDAARIGALAGEDGGDTTVFAYQYCDANGLPGEKIALLIAESGALLTWAEAYEAGIVSFADGALAINYIVVYGLGDPFVYGNSIVIPDGRPVADQITDPTLTYRKAASKDDDSGTGSSSSCAAAPGVLLLLAPLALAVRGRNK